MRKIYGLAVVGLAIASGVTFHIASQARVNQPIPSTSPYSPVQDGHRAGAPTSQYRLPPEEVLVKNKQIDPAILECKDVDGSQGVVETCQPSIHRQSRALPIPEETSSKVRPKIQNPNLHDSTVLSQSRNNLVAAGQDAQTPRQEIPQTEEVERFQRVIQEAIARQMHEKPMGEIMQAIARQFLGTAYKADLLDQSKEETLVVTLKNFDCVLFVESVLAIARGVAVQDYSYQTFVNHIRDQRYENGQMNGYCSRLHYFSAWINDNQKRGTVQNIAGDLGGVPLNKKNLNYMSRHWKTSPQLVRNDANYQCIVEMEAQLDGVNINYIPTNQIRRVYSQLQPGDIVAVATDIAGLDVTHTGLVYRHPDGNMGFIHASPAGRVTISRDLQRYVGHVEHAIGILVARPIDPRQ
jgi:hypothetical protein